MAKRFTTHRKRRREQAGEDPESRSVRSRLDDTNVTIRRDPLDDGEAHPSVPLVDHQDSFQSVQFFEDSSTIVPPLDTLPQLPWNVASHSEPFGVSKHPVRTITPPRTDGTPLPTLTEVNPESGSVTGGARIWLKGINFPALPLFARFGSAVVPTVSPKGLPFDPPLIKLSRLSPPVTFLPAICLK